MRQLIKILLTLYCFNATALFAQDVITLKSGDEIKAKVQEIGTDNVKYKKYENLDGPVYTLMKSEIFMIKYENGEKDIFKEATTPATTPQSVQAAQSVQTVQTGTLTFENNFFGHSVLDDNGKRLTKNEVRARLAKTPDALKSYNAGKKMLVGHNICYWAGIFEMVYGVSTLASDKHWDDAQGKWVNQTNTTSVGLMILGGATLIGGAVLSIVGNSKIESAVELYNQTSRSGGASSELSLNFGVTRSGGVGLTLNF